MSEQLRQPIHMTVDFEVQAAYVRYGDIAPGGRVHRTIDVHDRFAVHVDYDQHDRLIGIEILGFDDAALEIARGFAREHGLAFPSNLAATLPESMPLMQSNVREESESVRAWLAKTLDA